MYRLSDSSTVAVSNRLLVASCLKSYRDFGRESRRPAETQRQILLDLVRRARTTEFGREHGFGRIGTIDEFRSRVPIRDYAGHSPYIEAISQGRPHVLTSDRVLLLQPSSGSTAASKLIPFTGRLRAEFMRGVKPWLANLYLNRKPLLSGRAYWAVTPAGNTAAKSDGAVPIGFDEDSGYFGAVEQFLLRRSMAVPDEVAATDDVTAWRYVTLLFLLHARTLSLASVWNATLLTLLLGSFERWAGSLLRDVRAGSLTPPSPLPDALHQRLERRLHPNRQRAEELTHVLRHASERERFVRIWPRLQFVSCWCDGNAAGSAAELREMLPGVELQPKGLMATEGIVSVPLIGHAASALAVRSHFFEFIERDAEHSINDFSGCTTRLAHELERGGRYSVVLTTGGGLFRYYLGDLIEVVGFHGSLPLLRFVGREDDVSDVVGEKLHAAHVERVLQEISDRFATAADFHMLAPHQSPAEPACYVLYVRDVGLDDRLLGQLAQEIDTSFRQNFHYDHCRKLGQLGTLRVFAVDDRRSPASEQRLAHLAACGRKLGTAKPKILEKDFDWPRAFSGRFHTSGNNATGGRR